MIGFLQPLALLGLAAAAIPPLLHLLGRRLPPTVVFPAVRYLVATEREHSRRLRLRNLLLMVLRTAVIALLVLAAARPVVRVGVGTAHPPTALALIVDNSLSSGAVVGGRRMLDLIAEQARRVLDRATPDDRVWLVLADGLPRQVSVPEARSVVDSLTPWAVRLDLGQAARTAALAIGSAAAELDAGEIVLLSDLQASAFDAGDPLSTRVLAWRAPSPPENRGVDSAASQPRLWSPGGAVVASIGGAAATPVAVRLVLDGRDVARAIAGPGDRVVLDARAPRRGWLAAAVALDPDELRADDVWWVGVRAVDPAPVRLAGRLGPFVPEAIAVLAAGGRVSAGDAVTLSDRLAPGATVLVPPADPALLGGVNRALAARGVAWRFERLIEGEWLVGDEAGAAAGAAVYRRYELRGAGAVVARAGGEPWLVRDGDVVIVGSRMEEAWTNLPVTAGFVPFVDFLVNRVAAQQAWIVRATPGGVVALPDAVDAVVVDGVAAPAPSDRRFPAPLEPGVAFLLAGPDTVGALEVNHDRRESRLEQADRRTLRAALGPAVQLVDTEALDRELFQGARRAGLSGLLLAAALVAALAELAMATMGSRAETA